MADNHRFYPRQTTVMLRNIFCSLVMLLSYSASAFYEETLNPTGCTFEEMEAFYMEELGIDANTPVHYLKERITDPYTLGITRPLKNGEYLIVLESSLEPSDIRITLAHELVHVRQLIRKEIRREEFRKNYHERSFEDEAFRLSLPLAAKFYTQLNCNE